MRHVSISGGGVQVREVNVVEVVDKRSRQVLAHPCRCSMHGIEVLRYIMRRVPVPYFRVNIDGKGVGELDVEKSMLAGLEMVVIFWRLGFHEANLRIHHPDAKLVAELCVSLGQGVSPLLTGGDPPKSLGGLAKASHVDLYALLLESG